MTNALRKHRKNGKKGKKEYGGSSSHNGSQKATHKKVRKQIKKEHVFGDDETSSTSQTTARTEDPKLERYPTRSFIK